MDDKEPTVAFSGIISKISTTVDGGWRVTLDLSASESQVVPELAALRDQVLTFAAVAHPTI